MTVARPRPEKKRFLFAGEVEGVFAIFVHGSVANPDPTAATSEPEHRAP